MVPLLHVQEVGGFGKEKHKDHGKETNDKLDVEIDFIVIDPNRLNIDDDTSQPVEDEDDTITDFSVLSANSFI
jgi:hypothetical protein